MLENNKDSIVLLMCSRQSSFSCIGPPLNTDTMNLQSNFFVEINVM